MYIVILYEINGIKYAFRYPLQMQMDVPIVDAIRLTTRDWYKAPEGFKEKFLKGFYLGTYVTKDNITFEERSMRFEDCHEVLDIYFFMLKKREL